MTEKARRIVGTIIAVASVIVEKKDKALENEIWLMKVTWPSA